MEHFLTCICQTLRMKQSLVLQVDLSNKFPQLNFLRRHGTVHAKCISSTTSSAASGKYPSCQKGCCKCHSGEFIWLQVNFFHNKILQKGYWLKSRIHLFTSEYTLEYKMVLFAVCQSVVILLPCCRRSGGGGYMGKILQKKINWRQTLIP